MREKTEEINIKKKKDRKISDVSIRELWNADKRSNSKQKTSMKGQ